MGRNLMDVELLEMRRFLSAGPVVPIDVKEPLAVGRTFTEYAGQKFSAKVGEITFKTIDESLTVKIDWGDGTQSAGKLNGSYATGEYYVDGKHTYAHAGKFNVNVKVFASVLGSPFHPTDPVREFNSHIKVKPLVPTDGGTTLTEVAGKQFAAKLGEFSFKTVDQLLDAQIDWGDGTHSTGKIVGAYNSGDFYVQGTHAYAQSGKYAVQVRILAHLAGNPNAPKFAVAGFTSVINVKPKA